MTKADEVSTSKREKDIEMGGSGSHGHGDSTCTETQWVEYIKKKLNENRVSRQAGIEKSCIAEVPKEFCGESCIAKVPKEFCGESCIAKVPKEFCRDINEAYKPCIISIGPYHRSTSETGPIEQRKWQCLNDILHQKSKGECLRKMASPSKECNGKSESDLEACQSEGDLVEFILKILKEWFKELKKLEVGARRSYLDDVPLESMYFMEMMLLDGCFIVHYLCDHSSYIPSNKPWLKCQIDNDLLLVENQLPFFVLKKIFGLVKEESKIQELDNFTLELCKRVRPSESTLTYSMLAGRDFQHLLHFYQAYLLYDDSKRSRQPPSPAREYQIRTIHSASLLKESGIKFKRAKPTTRVLDVSFSFGVISITPLVIDAFTSSQFRNLIAFEKLNPSIEPRFTAFAAFMDYIINTSTDVKLLRENRIIQHALGSDDEVATIFNQLNTRTFGSLPSDLETIYDDANVFYGKKTNKWMAILKQKYMDSPWPIISFIFGVVLVLLLTIVQAFFAMYSYFKPAS